MRSLCYYGNPVLRKMCKEVTEITPHVQRVIQELKEVVRRHNGSGLAAPQIGYDLRIFVNDLSEKTDEDGYPLILEETEVYINPKITKFSKRKFIRDEGCLSIPGMSAEVVRSYDIEIEYMNEKGEKVVAKEKKWRAKCLQHELDHVNGILYIDHISKGDMQRISPSLISLEAKTKKNLNSTVSPSDFQI
jgi:peptide deformylase